MGHGVVVISQASRARKLVSMRRTTSLLAIVALALAFAGSIATSAAARGASVLSVYESTGSIPPCEFSTAQLAHALHSLDTYDLVYFQDFPNAINTALAARASGACSGARKRANTSAAARAPLPNIPVTSSTGSSVPLPMLLLALIFVLGAIGAGGSWLLRRSDPAWVASTRHSLSEAGYRVGGAWAELTDRRRPRRR
jgi:hypothetical protein